jgi:hypothetical protein
MNDGLHVPYLAPPGPLPGVGGCGMTATQTHRNIGADGVLAGGEPAGAAANAGDDARDDVNSSIAGEEDPGAALDTSDIGTFGPAAACPKPPERAA